MLDFNTTIYILIIFVLYSYYVSCKRDMETHMKQMQAAAAAQTASQAAETSKSVEAAAKPQTSTFAPTFSPETMVINSNGEVEDNSWSEAIQKLSLEPGIAESNKKYVENRSHVSSGASSNVIRDDLVTVTGYVGLRRPNYNVKVGSDARVVPSDDIHDKNTLLNDSRTELRWR
jgi:hypothetical protein